MSGAKGLMITLLLIGLAGCDDYKKQWQHNNVEYVRHHHCVKSRLRDESKRFDSTSNKVVIDPGTDAYDCNGVMVFIDDDEEQP